MNWPNQKCRLAVLAGCVALGLPISVVSGKSLPQSVSQNQAPGASPGSQQGVPTMPATMTAQPPGIDQAPASTAPAAASAPLRSLTPEEQGDLLMAKQRYQAGIEAYKKVEHRSADVWNKMGIGYQLMFNREEASHCYQASLHMEPKNARVMNNLGTIFDSEKQFGNAERLYHKALKLEPRSALIYKNLGTNQLAQHHYKKGWEAYKRALEIDPNIFQNNNSSPRVENPASVAERGAMNYYMAKGCVRAGMNDCAIDYLRMALNEGFTSPKKIEADGEFAGLKGVPAFRELLAEQRQQ
jgi:tetratricopeptide (TPR) repeat protein